ncbi:MAG TPA: hypothetical protein VIM73_04040, partial [Polyangiaceae bacterium]
MAPSTKSILATFAAVLAAAVPAVALWSFTVDDALISARVAHRLAVGQGYRFNATGPIVDAVTPLGWAPLLSLFARGGPLEAFAAAKVLGLGVWLGAAGVLGNLSARHGTRAAVVTALALLATTPLAAWAVSGMETGLVMAMATLGLVRWRGAALSLGLCAGLRPELLPWAFTLAGVRAALEEPEGRTRVRRIAVALFAASAPFLLVVAIRLTLFGQAAPLALLAKPSDAEHGARYALGALALSGPAWLLIAGPAYRKASASTRASVAALGVHGVALVVAGGDWMPLYRLFVPILPSVILAGAELAELSGSRVARALRLVALLGVCTLVAATLGPSARAVGEQRRQLIHQARPLLAGGQRVAALDIGWLGAATDADIVDLAG